MFIREVAPDLPTTSVASELISRTGSPTKFSLSPYQGMFRIIKEQGLAEVTEINQIVKRFDDFTFFQQDFREERIDEDADEDELEEWGQIQEYKITDKSEPMYFIRFEDGIPQDNMVQFLKHVLNNAKRSKDGIKEYLSRNKVATTFEQADTEETVASTELMTETDFNEDKVDAEVLQDLAYSLYRMNILSRKCGVNILSLVFAYMKSIRFLRSEIPDKPSILLQNGPIYYADINGDCTQEIQFPSDRKLTAARDILIVGGRYTEFENDYKILSKTLRELGIDFKRDDVTKYDHVYIKEISHKILVNNYNYVSRTFGGYNRKVLKGLKSISLDTVAKSGLEEEFDPVKHAIDLIMDSVNTPSEIYRAFTRKGNLNSDMAFQVRVLQTTALLKNEGLGPNLQLSDDGFMLDTMNNYYRAYSDLIAKDKELNRYTTGWMYFHRSGYVVLESLTSVILITKLEDIDKMIQMDDSEFVNVWTIGNVE